MWIYSRQDTSGGMTVRGGSKPALHQGVLYVGFSDGSIVAINSKTGSEQWEQLLNRNTKFKDIDASPVIDGEQMFINSYDDKLYALSTAKGEILWSAPYGGASTPLVTEDTVYTSSSKGEFVALNRKNAELLWKKSTRKGVFIDPLLYGDLVVSGESQGKLVFFNKKDGEIVGSFEPGRGVFSKPALFKDRLYFISGEGNIYGVEAKYQSKSSIYYLK
jgi:outer membrane protein assembly factor BamB